MILRGCLNVCAYRGSPSQHLPLAQGNPRILVVKLDVSHLDLEVNFEVSRRISRCAFDHRLMRTNWLISATSCPQSCILKMLTHIQLCTLPNPDVAVYVKSPYVVPFEFAEKCHFQPLVALWSKASAHCFNVEQMHLSVKLKVQWVLFGVSTSVLHPSFESLKWFLHQKSGCCGWLPRFRLQWLHCGNICGTSRCSCSTEPFSHYIPFIYPYSLKCSKYSISTKLWVNTQLLFLACMASCLWLVSN